jgi:PhzF family phenazine biosynthesis protein
MALKITQVDAFAERPFTGNPAAVCILEQPREESWMQLVAREMNLSETAFLVAHDGGYDLRWFTPAVEVALCGHATLASAHVLWEDGYLRADQPAIFHTKSGVLTARKNSSLIEMDFPATPMTPDPSLHRTMEAALGLKIKTAGRTRFDVMVEVEDEASVRALRPDITKIGHLDLRGLIVTSAACGSDYDYVSRFFAPGAGVDEDPVTGSAHCCLGPFWKQRLGRGNLTGYQASARGGYVGTRCEGDRVILSGHAITVLRGEMVACAEQVAVATKA